MAGVLSLGLALLGIVAGMFLWAQMTRWVVLLYVSGSREGGDFLGPPKRRLIWAIPFLTLLHPTPWIIGAAIFFAIRAFRGSIGPGWAWFFGGVSIAILLMSSITVAMIAHWRKSALSQVGGTNKSLERTREG
jgi:hypothetical protein